ncbi:short-chain dehydrogenase [Paenibacillus sp. CAA11]|uniref:SDR family oxidoreductase n=1 Tax=Paenibacillus sp. CAA11 TaxID=1532905 RepID=UPI000D39D239|nr:SDR family NAD(P)-dependent oxidoreductase [Paenibacillus sp. CAA11]AWB44503.1 short-chain dehydrogenase [Paenibacillus sp. CAA11]
MKLSGNTILITGGGSGIGLALAKRFVAAGNEVIICGRRETKLNEAKSEIPSLHTKVCDLSSESDREALIEWATAEFPNLNVLVNNAGIQQRVNVKNAKEPWSYYQQEITSNLEAPVHLTLRLLPSLMAKPSAAIINVSSGLAFTPGVWVPIYSATKAALHSFTISLRHQLEDTSIELIEVLPPAVNTDLGGPGLHTFGAPLDDFADAVIQGIEQEQTEIGYGGTEQRLKASREELDEHTRQAWDHFLIRTPGF